MDCKDNSVKSFSDLKLNSWICRQCESVGIKHPTPIQTQCIPHILAGEDCIGCAKTGSGKTLAFALPILQKLCDDPYGIFALVLTPTRELAFQIADQFQIIGKTIHVKVCVVIGGMDMVMQGRDLARKPHVVIATPGRLVDHLESCDTFSLKKIQFLVLDEADRLLEGSFDHQLKKIFSAISPTRQTLLFSATITDALKKVEEVAVKRPFIWTSQAEVATVEELDQFYVLCPRDTKDGYLVEILRKRREKGDTGAIIIFTDTCKNCQILSSALLAVGFENVALHSMMPQRQRLASLAKFKSNVVRILLATDVASRGLDIPTVELVLNHNIPNVPKDYIHRVGRTARAGRGGMAISLVTPYDIRLIHAIEELINTKLQEYKVDDKEVLKILTQVSLSKREAEIQLNDSDVYERKAINKRKKNILEGTHVSARKEKRLKQRARHMKKEQKRQ